MTFDIEFSSHFIVSGLTLHYMESFEGIRVVNKFPTVITNLTYFVFRGPFTLWYRIPSRPNGIFYFTVGTSPS